MLACVKRNDTDADVSGLLFPITDRVRMFENIVGDYRRHDSSLRNGGFWALLVYRFGRWSLRARSERPFVGRICGLSYGQIKPLVTWITGVDLECTTQVGEAFHIVHSTGVSIHPNAVIGDRVGVMHGVTIGSNMGQDVPVIGNDVFIGCNASILGGVKIGDGARVAANSLVISDVPPGSMAMGVPARCIPGVSRLREARASRSLDSAQKSLERTAKGEAPAESRISSSLMREEKGGAS